jgi:signal transduction histidine kinase
VTSRNFLRRVDAITDTSRNIMEGDLARRMPVSGSGDELDRLSRSLNEMLDQIERLMAGIKEVSSNVAHDLKTPLTRLRARVESALRSGSAADYRDALDQTIVESDQLLNTFNALLSIARAESGQAREGFEVVDAKSILTDVAELYEPVTEEAGGAIKVTISESLPLRADRQLLAQALSNLIDNALKYGSTDHRSAIELTGEMVGDKIVLAVADHGSGIAAEDRERVKSRFVRLEGSRTKPGNGLGLALVASVMKLHGGVLVLEDNAPGLVAKLVLPRAPAPR